MSEESIVDKAIESVNQSVSAYCKFLSANDSGETGGHQAGILISKKALPMLFDTGKPLDHIEKRTVMILWQNDYRTASNFTWYESKGELRITSFGRGFPYLNKEDTGALFVFTEQGRENYEGYFLYTEEEIDTFLNAFGLSPTETNNLISEKAIISKSQLEHSAIQEFIESITIDNEINFPDSFTMSKTARDIENMVYNHREFIRINPDKKIIDWTEQEYRLFRQIEQFSYGSRIAQGFHDMESFVELANQVLNRRKSRAGKSLEHHISAIFDGNNIAYEEQVITEGKKKPDFIFPSGNAYHDKSFPTDKLVSLASKTTCKDRWRQVINEADRLRDRNKYLLTLQQGISSAQIDEMTAEKVILVVPKPYISSYPREQQDKIWTIKKFVSYLQELEA